MKWEGIGGGQEKPHAYGTGQKFHSYPEYMYACFSNAYQQ